MQRLVFVLAALLCLNASAQSTKGPLSKILFFANPMGSDNDVIRRSSPDVPSVAERNFFDLSRGVFDVVITQDGTQVSADKLSQYQCVVFFTAINPPGVDVEALAAWVEKGGAFVGIHSTANTYQGIPVFGELLGARYDRRPWRTRENPQTKVTVKVNNRTHPATKHLGESFEITDDIYLFKNYDASKLDILLSLDPKSLDLTNSKMNQADKHLPVAWSHAYGKGRVFYTALGDWEPTWKNPGYRIHLIEGIRWAMKVEARR